MPGTTTMHGGSDTKGSAKAAHVNMMTDTIIANLPPEGLRAVMRALLGTDVNVTSNFHSLSAKYLEATKPAETPILFTTENGVPTPTREFYEHQRRVRCLMGVGNGFESLAGLTEVITRAPVFTPGEDILSELWAAVDGDIVQAVTAIQKELLTGSGMRPLAAEELEVVQEMRDALVSYMHESKTNENDFVFGRGLLRLEKLEGQSRKSFPRRQADSLPSPTCTSISETVILGDREVPRMFMGLWQFSSPAWGTASRSRINSDFRKHLDAGFLAYDMADHYGDAEVTFGQFRSAQADGDKLYCATKWAVFDHIKITKEAVQANVTERLVNVDSDQLELLQFHWQHYDDHQYIEACKLLAADPRIKSLGLCNFDTKRMNEIIDAGVDVVSNQVQFSLIDLRPTFEMAESCKRHKVKLLTYGSLCGGFLADKWLNKPAPSLFDADMTPSHRKYFEMIAVWGGWSLFQELLSILSRIGSRYGVSITSVAVRWVLEHDYVGAVIVGARMGTSEHVEDNLKVFSFRLDSDDMAQIQAVLNKCKARDVFEAMGDCGAEYRV